MTLFLIDAVIKATILLAAATLVTSTLLRRGSAAQRHLVWTIALLAALVLPALTIALPRWQVPVIELPVQGATANEVADGSPAVSGVINANLGSSDNLQVFAGPRDDPFFIDLEAAFCILPDRKPEGGALSQPCALTPNPAAPFFFRNPGVNYVQGFNVLSIVVELPSSLIENGAPGKLGIWGTISR